MPQSYYRERYQIDHIIARQHGGPTILENLALCCLECNLRKGPNIAGIDPRSGAIVPLFHPRKDQWAAHFRRDAGRILGLTPAGRATVAVLDLNRAPRVVVRQMLIDEGVIDLIEE
jgi:hypothetical protein